MGDGGAYFIGFMMATIGLMLGIRNDEVSHWFILLLFIYPLYETTFSVYRRKIIHDTDATQPDANHLHSLVYRKLISCDRFKHNKVICNSMTAPVMWLLSLVGIAPAIIWFDNQTALIIWAFVFMLVYTIIYKYISSERFKFNH
jgi:UDP-N-acetylmuramyl pentapeptide phosphotransferase/UDP-N-acetylglucosamine-1-phosphate transferase